MTAGTKVKHRFNKALTGKVVGQGRGRFRGMLKIERDDVPSAIRSLEFSLGTMHHRVEFLRGKI